jgi:hypothetical protein
MTMQQARPKRLSYREELRRERLKKALLYWGGLLLVALILAGWVMLQNMHIGSGRVSGWDPTQQWHNKLDNPYSD